MSFILTAWSFLTSKIGQYAAIAGGVLLFLWYVFTKGKDSEKAKQVQADLNAYKTRDNVDNEINSKSETDLDDYLDKHTSGRVRNPKRK